MPTYKLKTKASICASVGIMALYKFRIIIIIFFLCYISLFTQN